MHIFFLIRFLLSFFVVLFVFFFPVFEVLIVFVLLVSVFLDFYNEPSNRKKYMFATPIEKELLYHFKKMSEEDRNEMIEIAKIKARKNPEKEK